MYERYHLPECYRQGEIFNFDPFTFKLAENTRVKGSEKWLVSLRTGSDLMDVLNPVFIMTTYLTKNRKVSLNYSETLVKLMQCFVI